MADGRVVNLQVRDELLAGAAEAEKQLALDELARMSQRLRAEGKQIVLCHGTFDLLHIGHVKHLQAARREGDVLLVTLTADEFVNKGPGRPVFTQQLRAENLAALQCVDGVAINHASTAVNVLELIKPHVYVKGGDYADAADDVTGNIRREREAVETHGGRIHFTQEITNSSSRLLNEHFQPFPEPVQAYLAEFKQRHALEKLRSALGSLADMKVLVLGDAIIDEYHYTQSLGETGKGNVLAVKYCAEERFAGGSIAVANHVAGFAGRVTLVTGLGGEASHEDFIRAKLHAKVTPVFFTNAKARTLVKRRFIGEDMSKLFEVYLGDDAITSPEMEDAVAGWLGSGLAQFDAVIVPDFGNGFVAPKIVDRLCRQARFLAVNTQVNSGNRGYHTITRYPRADFISLNEPELRMAAGDRHGDLQPLAQRLVNQLDAQCLAVTRGTRGVLMTTGGAVQAEVPALSTQVVDRIGAGDAFLAVAGLCLAAGVTAELAAFFGSIAGALNVQTVCNREPVDPVLFQKYLTTLLK